ncbi:MAG: S9 family peptidase [Thermoanaerobaculia bacterium]|jgi:dipeptidyl aminopeptidase/acylaminoacyl peptidase|nr:S9 family peptidase [Thermoanaerobaculia bacterium]MBP9825857.1 S9 family peptidase [Thermoanaerobaculia bacterium]
MRPERLRQVLFSFTGLFAFVIAAALPVAASAAAAAAEPHPFTVHDLLAMQRISDPQVSPDGTQVLFTLRTTDLDANAGRNDLWLVGADGSGLRQITTHKAGDFNGRWASDGRAIYFLSTRSGSSQVFKLAFDGGEAVQVTDLPVDVSNLELSPDGSHLGFSLEVFPACGADLDCTKKRLDENDARKASGKIYDSLFIRHWDTWADGRRNHLFVLPSSGPAMATTAVDLMPGFDADAPSKPFGGSEEYTFTPDGKGIVYSARNVGREEAWSTNFDLFFSPIDGKAAPRKLTTNPAWDTQPVFSPDGKQLVYMKMARPGFEADRFVLVVRDGMDGADRVLTQGWDRSPEEITWSADGKTIYVAAQDVGQKAIFAIDAATGAPRSIIGAGTNGSIGLAAGGRLVYSKNHLKSPAELWTANADGSNEKRITKINDERVAAVKLGEPEQMSFRGAGGDMVFAYIVKPVDFDPAKKYPVAFLIHGGPQGSFGNDFHYRWNPQTYAARGYAAVMVDFHGSTGYGQAFTDAIRGDWGGKPLEDLKKGLDAALAAYPWMDGERVGALGASYGGYMVNWIAGAWPDRFKALVSHDGNLDERFAYYATEELWFPEWEHGGTPWENPAGYAKHNPVDLVKNWKTPVLVVHGALDYRVVDTGGIATFTAAQRKGIPSKLLYFPDENHWVLKPHNSILWHDTVLDWLDQWVKGEKK